MDGGDPTEPDEELRDLDMVPGSQPAVRQADEVGNDRFVRNVADAEEDALADLGLEFD